MRKLPLSLGTGMIIALFMGFFGLFSVSGTPYMGVGATFSMDWSGLAINIVAWVVVVYALLFAVEKVRRKP